MMLDTINENNTLLWVVVILFMIGFSIGFNALITNNHIINLSSFDWISYIILGLIVLAITEIFYLLSNYEINKKTSLLTILEYKLINLMETSLILINGLNLIWLFRQVKNWSKVGEWIIKIFGWLGIVGLGVLLIIGWLWINKKVKQ